MMPAATPMAPSSAKPMPEAAADKAAARAGTPKTTLRPAIQQNTEAGLAAVPLAATVARPAPLPASAASNPSPSTAELLDAITQGVLKAAKNKQAPRSWLGRLEAASQPEHNGMSRDEPTLASRVERVRTPFGTYCVNVPNAATAYRSPNGVNIVGAGNCPRD